MSKNRVIFYIVFALFHLGAFVFTVVLENNTNLLFSMVSWVPYFKWITFLGVILIIADVIWSWIVNRDSQREKAVLIQELNTLKAKLFDLQESSSKGAGSSASQAQR
jgi:hypothetical protein